MAVLAAVSPAHAALNISSAPTKNMSCAANVCRATAKKAVLNASDLQGMLATSDVTVKTGGGALTIGVYAPVTWGSTHRLTLQAGNSIHVNAPMIVEGQGGVTLRTGGLGFVTPGSLTFWDLNSSLVINGGSYTLVDSIASLDAALRSNRKGLYALAKDYDASVDGTYTAAPIVNAPSGIVEGLGHAFDHLTIALPGASKPTGLFAHLTLHGTIRDLGVENVHITAPPSSQSYIVGALVGENNNGQRGGGAIVNSWATGTIDIGQSDNSLAGGLAGINAIHGSIVNSRCDCAVTLGGFHTRAGGLVGYNGGVISGSSATGPVAGDRAGGLVSWNIGGAMILDSHASGAILALSGGGGLVDQNDGMISNSSAAGPVTNQFDGGLFDAGGFVNLNNGYIGHSIATGGVVIGNLGAVGGSGGGFAATNRGTITTSYATGNVSANHDAGLGGFVGMNDEGNISKSFATGSVTGHGDFYWAGGFAGESEGPVTDCYALGAASGGSKSSVGGFIGLYAGPVVATSYSAGLVTQGKHRQTGGFIGFANAAGIQDDYWDTDTSGWKTSDGAAGLSDAQLKSGLPAGFDSAIWGHDAGVNSGLPYLIGVTPP